MNIRTDQIAIPQSVSLTTLNPPVRLKRSWLLWGLFAGFPLYWILGLGGFIQAIYGVLLIFMLFFRGDTVRMPRACLAWVLYCAWALICAFQLSSFEDAVSFVWRWSISISALLLFIYVYSTPRDRLPSRKIIAALGTFWIVAVMGGFFGLIAPSFQMTTIVESLLPDSIAADPFVKALTHVRTASPTEFGSTGIHRPLAPFIFTNQWGSGFALTLPFAIAWAATTKSRTWRRTLVFLMLISIVPLITSFDRGGWLSTAFAVSYALIRLALSGNRRTSAAARHLLILVVVVAIAIFASPLYQLIDYRLESNFSDVARTRLYESSWVVATRSPIFGYGATVPFSEVGISAEFKYNIGTQGMFWTVLVSQGFVGVFFFLLFFAFLFFKTYRIGSSRGGRDPTARFWAHISIVAAGSQLPIYEFYPYGIMVIFVAGAIALREWAPPPRPKPLEPSSVVRQPVAMERMSPTN